jgi:GT2 family glycosyltransferase
MRTADRARSSQSTCDGASPPDLLLADLSRVSVVVPLGSGSKSFPSCLSGLRQCTPPPYEIIIVIDGAVEMPWEALTDHNIRVVRLPKPRPQGPATARNAGADVAAGDILLFVDSDVLVKPDIIFQVERELSERPGIAAIFGSYDDQPQEKAPVSQFRNLLHHFVHQNARPNAETFWAACGAIKKSAFQRANGFKESYSAPSIEDIELGQRLRSLGYSIQLCRDIQVKHLKRWTLLSTISTDICLRAIPWTELILVNRRLINDLNTSYKCRFSVMAIGVGFLLAIAPLPLFSRILAVSATASILALLNLQFYSFLFRSKGMCFCLMSLPMHWLHLACCGLGFAAGVIVYISKACGIGHVWHLLLSHTRDRSDPIERKLAKTSPIVPRFVAGGKP